MTAQSRYGIRPGQTPVSCKDIPRLCGVQPGPPMACSSLLEAMMKRFALPFLTYFTCPEEVNKPNKQECEHTSGRPEEGDACTTERATGQYRPSRTAAITRANISLV